MGGGTGRERFLQYSHSILTGLDATMTIPYPKWKVQLELDAHTEQGKEWSEMGREGKKERIL